MQGVGVGHVRGFGVEVELVELLHPAQHLLILVVAQVLVGAASVPRVEGVEANDVERLLGEAVDVGLEDAVQVLVVAPRHQHLVQAAVLLVDAQPRVQLGVLHVRVLGEALHAEHDAGVRSAADWEGVPDHAPLGLSPQGHQLPRVVHKPGHLQPLLVRVVLADALRRLEGVEGVGQVDVRVALVHQVVQLLQGFQDGEAAVVQTSPVLQAAPDEVQRLVGVHEVVGPDHVLRHVVDAEVAELGDVLHLGPELGGVGQGHRQDCGSGRHGSGLCGWGLSFTRWGLLRLPVPPVATEKEEEEKRSLKNQRN